MKEKRISIIISLLGGFTIFFSCNQNEFKTDRMIGTWIVSDVVSISTGNSVPNGYNDSIYWVFSPDSTWNFTMNNKYRNVEHSGMWRLLQNNIQITQDIDTNYFLIKKLTKQNLILDNHDDNDSLRFFLKRIDDNSNR